MGWYPDQKRSCELMDAALNAAERGPVSGEIALSISRVAVAAFKSRPLVEVGIAHAKARGMIGVVGDSISSRVGVKLIEENLLDGVFPSGIDDRFVRQNGIRIPS